MAVVQMHPKGVCVELIREILSRVDEMPGHGAVHSGRMEAMKMHGMWLGSFIGKMNPYSVAFCRSDGWRRDLSIIGPGWIENAWRDFDFLVFGIKPVFPQRAPVRALRFPVVLGSLLLGKIVEIPCCQVLRGVKSFSILALYAYVFLRRLLRVSRLPIRHRVEGL